MKRFLLIFSIVLSVASAARAQLLVPPTTAECATSVDGSVVGVPNPLNPPIVAAVYSGTLPAGNYFVQEAWYDASANTTLVGPEVQIQLSGTGEIQEDPPTSGMSANAVGRNIYIGTTSGGETLQGTVVGSGTYTQSVPLVAGAAVPASNNTICKIIANDAGWPTGTGYVVSLTTPAGNTVPGYPMQWQLLGPGNTINLGNGLPIYNGTVTYPIPILARPYGHGPQSISGPLSLGGYGFTSGSVTTQLETITNPSGDAILNLNSYCITGGCASASSNHLLAAISSNNRSGEFEFQDLTSTNNAAAAWEFFTLETGFTPYSLNVKAPAGSLKVGLLGGLQLSQGITAGTGTQFIMDGSPCTNGTGLLAVCNDHVPISPTLLSSGYEVVCTGVGLASGVATLVVAGRTTGYVSVNTYNLDSGVASGFSEIDCFVSLTP